MCTGIFANKKHFSPDKLFSTFSEVISVQTNTPENRCKHKQIAYFVICLIVENMTNFQYFYIPLVDLTSHTDKTHLER